MSIVLRWVGWVVLLLPVACGGGSDGDDGNDNGGSAGAASAGSAVAGASSSGAASGSVSPTEPSCEDPVALFCRSYATSEATCDGVGDAADAFTEACTAYMGGRPLTCGFATAYADCLATNECQSDVICLYAGFLATSPSGWDTATIRLCLDHAIADLDTCAAAYGGFSGRCHAKASVCGDAEEYFDDFFCDSAVALSTAAQAEADDCLSLPCTEVEACLDQAGAFNYYSY